jgi:hypothetical protein
LGFAARGTFRSIQELGHANQPALFWIRKLRGGAKFDLHIAARHGTSDESLHLFLMGRGWTDEKGFKLIPPGQSLPTTALSVLLETTDLFTALSTGQPSPDNVALPSRTCPARSRVTEPSSGRSPPSWPRQGMASRRVTNITLISRASACRSASPAHRYSEPPVRRCGPGRKYCLRTAHLL